MKIKFQYFFYNFFDISFLFQIEETDALPKCLCDSCIIQLNVAYNLKKNAVQSDVKLRQYAIEYGMSNPPPYTTCINAVSIVHPTEIIMPSVTETTQQTTILTQTSTSTISSTSSLTPRSVDMVSNPKKLTVMPILIKEEPKDVDDELSDISILENGQSRQRQGSSSSISYLSNNGTRNDRDITPFNANVMVAVNDSSLLRASLNSDKPVQMKSQEKLKSSKSKKVPTKRKSRSPKTSPKNTKRVRTSPRIILNPMEASRELKKLNIDMKNAARINALPQQKELRPRKSTTNSNIQEGLPRRNNKSRVSRSKRQTL